MMLLKYFSEMHCAYKQSFKFYQTQVRKMDKKNRKPIRIIITVITLIISAVNFYILFEQHKINNSSDCSENFDRIEAGLYAYAESHDGKLPNSKTWKTDILPYIDQSKTTFDCPHKRHSYAMDDRASEKEVKKLSEYDVIVYQSPKGTYHGIEENDVP